MIVIAAREFPYPLIVVSRIITQIIIKKLF